MSTTTSATADVGIWGKEDTEICNSDGFVYKRKKRTISSQEQLQSSSSPSAAIDAIVENQEANRRERRKAILLSIKERYRAEMAQWDRLSSATEDLLAEASRNTKASVLVQDGDRDLSIEKISVQVPVDEIIAQVDVQEAMIDKLFSVCDVVDQICDTREEAALLSLADLPVWATNPRALLSSLTE